MKMTDVTPFETGAAEYDAWFDWHADLYQAELAAVRSLLPAVGDGVEIGVGTGRFAASLGIAVGVEPSPAMAELARRRGIKVHEGIAEALPFADGSVDYAVMVTVVCFLDDVARAFREVFRVLKPAGSLIVAFIDRESPLGRQYQQRKDRSRFYREATFYSVAEIKTFLRAAGFSGFDYRQTLLADPASTHSVLEGYGCGGFVVIRAQKAGKGKTA